MGCLFFLMLNLISCRGIVGGFVGNDFREGRGGVNSGLLETRRRCAPGRDPMRTPRDLLAAVARRSVPNLSANRELPERKGNQIGLKPAGLIVTVFTGVPTCTAAADFLRARHITRILARGALPSRPVFSVADRGRETTVFFQTNWFFVRTAKAEQPRGSVNFRGIRTQRCAEWGCSATSVWYRITPSVSFCVLTLVTDCAVTTVSIIHDHSVSRAVAAVVVQFVDQPDRYVWSGGGDGNPRGLAGTQAGFAGVEENPVASGAGTAPHRRGAGRLDDSARRRVSDHPRHYDRHAWLCPADSRVKGSTETQNWRVDQTAGADADPDPHQFSHQRPGLSGVQSDNSAARRREYHRRRIRS